MSVEGERVHLNGWDQQHEVPQAPDPSTQPVAQQTAVIYGRQIVLNADGVWRDQFGRVYERDGDDILCNGVTMTAPKQDWDPIVPAASWQDREVPRYEWLLDDWIPVGQCTCLSGEPGSRKSTLALQLMIAMAAKQIYFLGRALGGQRRVLGYFCEDPESAFVQRGTHILAHYESAFKNMQGLNYRLFVGKPDIAFVYFDHAGRMITTPAFDNFKKDLNECRPSLVVLDVIPKFFNGNENDRHQVSEFITLLDGVAQEYNCAILFTSHPSVRGKGDRSLTSGSTAWEGCVRSRITIEDPKPDGEPSDKRVLRLVKSNYSKTGEEIVCTVTKHTFKLDSDGGDVGSSGQLRHLTCQAHFLKLLDLLDGQGRYVTASTGSTGAPHVFNGHTESGGFTKREFQRAMDELFNHQRIKLELSSHSGHKVKVITRT